MAKRDDLTKIKGLGRGSQKLLNAAGIFTYKELSKTSPKKIRLALSLGGINFERLDSANWSREARKFESKEKIQSSKPHRKTTTTERKKAKSSSNEKKAVSSAKSAKDTPVTIVFSNPATGQAYQPGATFVIERILAPWEVDLEYLARKDELDKDIAKARKVLEKWWKKLKKTDDYQKRHLTGASVRFRTKFGQVVSPLKVVIAINVAMKLNEDDLENQKITILPKVVDGIPVKIIGGAFQFIQDPINATSLTGSTFTSPNNPLGFDQDLVGGVPIAPPGSPNAFGTLGVVFKFNGSVFEGISCSHVVRNVGLRVDQRGPDVVGAPSTRPIGKVEKVGYGLYTPPGMKGESIDCALVKIDPSPSGGLPVSMPMPPGTWIRDINVGNSVSPVEIFFSKIRADAGMRGFELWKFGSSTGVRLTGSFGDFDLHEIRIGHHVFTNNFTVVETNASPDFVLPGDSGSIIALRAKHTDERDIFVAIGLLFAQIAGNNAVGVACNISHVIDKLLPSLPASRKISQWKRP